ncbi:MAG TPA: hypothetical protein VFE06_05960 [Acidobacteriaceae bacterium]|jgi:hypothetical protein|nr:hypothetical protein [Acidobacteriaceae bacterium]
MATVESAPKHVLTVGNEVRWTATWGSGTGIYMGRGNVFNFQTGEVLNVGAAEKLEVDEINDHAKPVVVVNSTPTKLRTVIFGVFLGNLLTGIIVGIVIALSRL